MEGDSDLLLMEVKLKLKKWEIDFVKKNATKPGRDDVASNPEIRQLYKTYARLKSGSGTKSVSSTPVKENRNTDDGNTKDVWGDALLKKNSAPDKVEIFDSAQKTPKNKSPPKSKTPSFRENMRKNIMSSNFASLRKSMNKRVSLSQSSPFKTQCHTEQSSTEQDDSSTLENPVDLNNSFSTALQDVKNTSFQGAVTPTKPTAKRINPRLSFSQNKGRFQTRVLDSQWFQQAEDDLSDLVELGKGGGKEDPCPSASPELKKPPPVVDKHVSPKKLSNSPTIPLSDSSDAFDKGIDKHSHRENTKSSYHENTTKDSGAETLSDKEKAESNHHQEKAGGTFFGFSKRETDEFDAVHDVFGSKPSPSVDEVPFASNVASQPVLGVDNETNDDEEKVSRSQPVSSTKQGKTSRSNGLVSNNFIRVNMKQKTFAKAGKGKFLRRQVYREKLTKKGFSYKSGWKGRSGGGTGKSEFRDKSEDKCFKCGETGHWASKCKGRATNFMKKPSNQEQIDLKEALDGITKDLHAVEENSLEQEDVLNINRDVKLTIASPVFNDVSDYDENQVQGALNQFGYQDFRPGQKQAVERILCGKSTLLVLSTGSGKSLCYQLPAFLFARERNSITLVISPLVSLMDDQVVGLPSFLRASRLHSGMTKEQRKKEMEAISEGKVDILLISPEAITMWAGMSSYSSPLMKLPPISFVCVDECHCLSEWSHSFRPSYLRVCKVLKEQLGVKCMVGLTATATKSTCISVAKQLGIEDIDQGIISKVDVPENLVLSVSRDRYKDEALESLLNGARFQSLASIIIYCTRRQEAARISAFLRTKIQYVPCEPEKSNDDVEEASTNTKKRKRGSKNQSSKRRAVTWEADCYHAGLSAAERKRVQKRFMSGQLRIVVATVAFGMGIDKQDVKAVIHYNMPRSFERYVQEVGRAGRDGLPAHCHLFLDSENGSDDFSELSRHIYGKSVDRYTVKKLLKKIFKPCKCDQLNLVCNGHYAAIDIDAIIDELDLAKEGIETLLCFLELDGLIKVYLPTETTCKIYCYGGAQQLARAAKKCPPLSVALQCKDQLKVYEDELEFSLIYVSNHQGIDLLNLKKSLRQLMWDTTLQDADGSCVGRSGINIEFKDLSFLVRSTKKCTDEFLDEITDALHKRVITQERKELSQLKQCYETMHKFSYRNAGCCMDEGDVEKSDDLKEIINHYFQQSEDIVEEIPAVELDDGDTAEVQSLTRQFINVHGSDVGNRISGRAIARIFHGIESPRYPARTWGPARRFWRKLIHLDFNAVMKVCTREVINYR